MPVQTMEPWLRDKPEAEMTKRYEALKGLPMPRSIVDRASRLGNIGQALSNLIGCEWDNYRRGKEAAVPLIAERDRVWDERDRLILRSVESGIRDPYAVLLRRARELGWPEKYVEDFREHDYRFLREHDNPEVFYWAIRDWGTNSALPKDFSWIAATWSVYGLGARYFKYERGVLHALKTRTTPAYHASGTATTVLLP